MRRRKRNELVTGLLGALLWLSPIGAPSAGAQSISGIAGRIVTTQGAPIEGASVRVGDANASTTTSSDGRFRFERIPEGAHRLDITATGYAPVTRRVQVQAGRVTQVDVILSTRVVALESFDVKGNPAPGSMRPADDVLGALLAVGAKSEIVQVAQMNGNLAEKTPRQIFARVPGVFVYDMDGSGNQVNISTRGLDAHRSWEMNVRQDGVLINSDIYGYPASHYSPPMEAIEQVELIRGTAALQYGSQFGGFLNYVTKEPAPGEQLKIESNSAVGAFGLLSSYAALSGARQAVSFHGYAQIRVSDGYRRGSRSQSQGQYLAVSWKQSEALKVRAQLGRSTYLYRIPGPLTDAMFESDPTQSTRSRNYFNPDILVPAVIATWTPGARTKVVTQLSGVFGERASVQFIGFANQPDTVLTATGQLAARQVDIDRFNSKTMEVRLNRGYSLRGGAATLASGIVVSLNDLHRRQQGTGSSGSNADFRLASGDFRRNIHYKTNNIAWYAENEFPLAPSWSVIPGMRVELGRTRMTGTLAYYDPADVPTSVVHRFPLFGVRSVKRWSRGSETYGGWSQAYRPMILQDVLPANALERTDPGLRDAKGWTIEAGQRGLVRTVSYDVSAFAMRYTNRYGVQQLTDASGTYLFKTNVGTTMTRGIELSAEVPLVMSEPFILRASTATSYFDATYEGGSIVSAGNNVDITGNRVEAVPRVITRNGIHLTAGRLSASAQVSHVTESFADALNTVTPSATGAIGLVPAYTIADLNGSIGITERVRLRAGVNNLLGASYFTKRPTFYPGPGVWPSDGRSFQIGVHVESALNR